MDEVPTTATLMRISDAGRLAVGPAPWERSECCTPDTTTA